MPSNQQVLDESTRAAQEAARVAGLGTFTQGVGVTGAPAAPVVDPTTSLVEKAGKAGVPLSDIPSLLPPADTGAIQDSLAQKFGYTDFNSFANDVFAAPSQSTTDLYNTAYKNAGLDTLLGKITDSKNKLAEATKAIGDNPWLDEASRAGRVGRLQTLANAEIGNNQDAYNAGLQQVQALTQLGANDLSQNEQLKQQKFQYLLQQAEAQATQQQATAFSKAVPDYLNSAPAAKPDTITVGDNVYSWDADSGTFKQVITGAQKPIELTAGSTLYDPTTGKAIYTAPKAAGKPTEDDLEASDMPSVIADLTSRAGTDGFVSENDYAKIRQAWVTAGHTSASFDTRFGAWKSTNTPDQ